MASLSATEIAELVGGELLGDGSVAISGVNSLTRAGPADCSFATDERHLHEVGDSGAGLILVRPNAGPLPGRTCIRVRDPQAALVQVTHALGLARKEPPFRGVSEKASVDPTATLGENVSIGPFAVVAAGARVGDGTVLYPGVVLDRDVSVGQDCVLYPDACVLWECRLGDRVTLGPGCVVGFDGFGFHPTPEGLVRIPQLGIAVVEDDVVLGAHVTVDRARFDATVIRRGAALDNLVHVAHNCSVGEHTAIAALTGLAGGVKIGNRCLVGGQVGFSQAVEVGDGCLVGAKSGVIRNFPPGQKLSGYVAQEHFRTLRELSLLRHLPGLMDRVRALEKRLGQKPEE